MTIDNFDEYIDPVIIDRGMDYQLAGNVLQINTVDEKEWHAIVIGSARYRVTVHLENRTITSSYCECPYDYGDYCKHEVAVYYEIRDLFGVETKTDKQSGGKRESKEERLDAVLASMDKRELQVVVKRVALENESFYLELINTYGEDIQPVSKKEYVSIIRQSLKMAQDRSGFINYHDSFEAVDGARNVLQIAWQAIEKGRLDPALVMAQAVIEVVFPAFQYCDDSAGLLGDIVSEGFDVIQACIDGGLEKKDCTSLFKYCQKAALSSTYDGWSDYPLRFIQFMAQIVLSDKQFDVLFSLIEQLLDKENADKYPSTWLREQLGLVKIELMKKSDRDEDAERFLLENVSYPLFRTMLLERAWNDADYALVEQLALDGEELAIQEKTPGYVKDWKEWRFKAYTAIDDVGKVREMAKDFFLNGGNNYYDILKDSYSVEEWSGVCQALIDHLHETRNHGFSNTLAFIYISENMISHLRDMVLQDSGYVNNYQEYLLPDYPDDVYNLHEKNIMSHAAWANSRSEYRRVCKSIKALMKIGGIEKAKSIIENLKKLYNRRPAFLDELGKIKI